MPRPSALYEPLCELAWRIVGHVLHAVIVLDETSDDSLPVPKARGLTFHSRFGAERPVWGLEP